jgi:hypothetical protein
MLAVELVSPPPKRANRSIPLTLQTSGGKGSGTNQSTLYEDCLLQIAFGAPHGHILISLIAIRKQHHLLLEPDVINNRPNTLSHLLSVEARQEVGSTEEARLEANMKWIHW